MQNYCERPCAGEVHPLETPYLTPGDPSDSEGAPMHNANVYLDASMCAVNYCRISKVPQLV